MASKNHAAAATLAAIFLAYVLVISAFPKIAAADNAYELISTGELVDDAEDKWLLYDHDTLGSVSDPYFRYSADDIILKMNRTNSTMFTIGGSDWRGISVSGSSDGVSYELLKSICCYGSGDYKVDTHEYTGPFYLKFTLSSGACCGKKSDVTLSKKVTGSSNLCLDSDGGSDYFTQGGVSGNRGDKAFEYKDECSGEKTLKENYCDERLLPVSVDYQCSDKCSGGKCIGGEKSDGKVTWQEGKSGTVKEKKIDVKDNTIRISFNARSTHPYTGYVYLVSSAPFTLSGKKLAVQTELDRSTMNTPYDEYGPTVVISPEKYLDADIKDDDADNSKIQFTTALRCYSNLNSINSGNIVYQCEMRKNGKTTALFFETVKHGTKDTKAEFEFNFQDNKVNIHMKTPGNDKQYSLEDAEFVSKFNNAYIYIGGASSSSLLGVMTLRNLTIGNEIVPISIGSEEAASKTEKVPVTSNEKDKEKPKSAVNNPAEDKKEAKGVGTDMSRYCMGCLFDKNVCVPVGTRVSIETKPTYCSFTEKFEEQKNLKESCQNSYECKTNMCVNSVCYDIEKEMSKTQAEIKDTRNIVERAVELLKSLFKLDK